MLHHICNGFFRVEKQNIKTVDLNSKANNLSASSEMKLKKFQLYIIFFHFWPLQHPQLHIKIVQLYSDMKET